MTTKNVSLPVQIETNCCTYCGPDGDRTLYGFQVTVLGQHITGGGDSNRSYKSRTAARKAGERFATDWARSMRDRAAGIVR